LGTRVRAFAPHDHPHPVRPTGQGQQFGQLGNLRAVAHAAAGA
jgi:hypothetical protein